jgi:hypothetical protein
VLEHAPVAGEVPGDGDDHAISGDCFASAAIRSCFVDTFVEFRGIRRVAQERFHDPTPRFPPLASAGDRLQASSVLSGAMTSCRPSRRASLPSLGGTSVALVLFAPKRTSAPLRPGVGHPVAPAGILPRRRQDLPSSWGTPIVRLHMFYSDADRTVGTRPYSAAAWPLVIERQRLL